MILVDSIIAFLDWFVATYPLLAYTFDAMMFVFLGWMFVLLVKGEKETHDGLRRLLDIEVHHPKGKPLSARRVDHRDFETNGRLHSRKFGINPKHSVGINPAHRTGVNPGWVVGLNRKHRL